MQTNDKTKLQIFENFQIDRTLPKFKDDEKNKVESTNFTSGVVSGNVWPSFDGDNDVEVDVGGGTIVSVRGNFASMQGMLAVADKEMAYLLAKDKKVKDNFLNRIRIGWKYANNKYRETRTVEALKKKITVQEFFKNIKASATQLKKIDGRLDSYQEVLKYVETTGQIALKEEITGQIGVIQKETHLYVKNLRTVILEEQVVQFAKESERGVRLDWIKNFTRVIPDKVVNTKKKADEINVFDNYVIMHYDPKKKASKETNKEEVARKKDPILFGVMEGSRKLYFIGDWIDEYCDLTLDTLIEKFGKKTIKANNISANVSIEDFTTGGEK